MSGGDHHTERISVFIPEFIKVEIGLNAETAALADRAISLKEGKLQKQVDDLAEQLNASTGALGTSVKDNPDPNPKD